MIITTKRCLIRPFEEKDLDTFVEYRNHKSWMIYQDFKGYTKDQYRQMIIDEVPNTNQGLQLAITSINEGYLIGDLYLKTNRDTCDLGYTIHPQYARLGYIFEAVKGIMAYLSSQGIKKINACAHKNNIASLNLLKKLGFKEIGIADNKDIAFEYLIEK